MDNESRIGLFLPSLDGGGAERVFVYLANQFVAWGRDVDMVLIWARGPYLSQLDPRVRVIDLAPSSKGMSLPALARYLRRERPRVLLSAMDIFNAVALLAGKISGGRTPIVVSCHAHMTTQSSAGGRPHDRFLPILARALYPTASKVIAVSSGVAEDLVLAARLNNRRITVIPDPAVTPSLEAKSEEAIDHPWFSYASSPMVVSIGRLHHQKDYPTLLHAFTRLREQRMARLVILGEGPERQFLKTLVDDLGLRQSVDMPGFVDNPFAYLARADLFVLSSAWEGFGMVLVEAMACGCPVVSTDCPSGPAEILEQGRYGALVPVGDAEALAMAMSKALDEPRDPARLKRRAADFAVEPIARRYLDVFDACSGGSGA